MSVFERKIVTKVHVDDTDILLANIINTELKDGHTEYVIRVQRGHTSDNRWFVNRRYNDFLALHNALSESNVPLPLPPKKIIGNLDHDFITERQSALQVYLDEVLQNPILSEAFALKRFLDPANYKITNDDAIFNELQMVVHNEMEIKTLKPLPQLGWRFRKKSYLVTFKDNPKKEYLLQWIPFGPDKHLNDEDIQCLFRVVSTLQHVNVAKIERTGLHKSGGWIIHEIKSKTILDRICNVKDNLHTGALKKFAKFDSRVPLDQNEVIEIASQILQALAYLHHKGIPYGHLHLGNILTDGNLVKLYGIENSLLGLPCFYRRYLVTLKNIDSLRTIDVYCFGLSLYEMLYAKPLDISTKVIPSDCPIGLRNVLESILSTKAMKGQLPSVKDLLNLQIFRRPPPNPHPYFKITQMGRENLDAVANKIIDRLKDDHLMFRKFKKAKAMQRLLTENSVFPIPSKETV